MITRHPLTFGQPVVSNNSELVQVDGRWAAPISTCDAQPVQFGPYISFDFTVGNCIGNFDQGDAMFTTSDALDLIASLQCDESLLANLELLDMFKMLRSMIFERQLERSAITVEF
jgi:hypothetical protein